MSSREQLDDRLNAACADGRMTVGDADEVRRFADFLAAIADTSTPDKARLYREHYPDQPSSNSEGTAS